MERDFKKEFIELKKNEIPDLWNRIEAGLSERKVTAPVAEKADSSFKKINWRRWGTLAAACLCVMIIIPAISLIIRNGGSENYTGSHSGGNTSNSPAMSYEEEVGASSDEPEMNRNGSDGASTADTGSMHSEGKNSTDMASDWDNSDAGVQDGMEMTQAGGVSESPSEAENTSVTAEADEGTQFENSEAIKDLNLKNGQVIENVLVQIVEADAAGEEIIYQAVVLEPDADEIFKKNMQIEIVCISDTEYDSISMTEKEMLKDNENYEVSLRFEQDKLVVTKVTKAEF